MTLYKIIQSALICDGCTVWSEQRENRTAENMRRSFVLRGWARRWDAKKGRYVDLCPDCQRKHQ